MVILNVLLERKHTFEVQRPFAGSLFKRGLSEQEVDERLLRLGVRCKGVTRGVRSQCTAKDVPEPLLTFLRRMVAHRQKYPRDFLLNSEKKALGIPLHSDRAGEIEEGNALVLLTHFLFSKILVLRPPHPPFRVTLPRGLLA